MVDKITEGVNSSTPSDSIPALNDFYSEFDPCSGSYDDDDLISVHELSHLAVIESLGDEIAAIGPDPAWNGSVLNIAKDSFLATEIDTSEIEFCRKSPLDRIRVLLKQREGDEFGQAILLVLLEHFRPDFFSLDQQIFTQGIVDLGRAAELVEKLNAALMFCSGPYYHVDDPAELAIIKHYLLRMIRDSNGVVNLRGEYHGGWINITGIATGQKGEILKLMVEIDPFRAPPVMFNYYKP